MRIECETAALGFPIRAAAERLDDGWDVCVYGGCRTHVGAMTLAEADGTMQTLLRPEHRDDAVSKRWAQALAQAWKAPVCVRAGIHYDGITRDGIAAALSACDALLQTMIERSMNSDGCTDSDCQPDDGAG